MKLRIDTELVKVGFCHLKSFMVIHMVKWAVSSKNNYERIDALQYEQIKNNQCFLQLSHDLSQRLCPPFLISASAVSHRGVGTDVNILAWFS